MPVRSARIGVDLMGSDYSPFYLYEALQKLRPQLPGVSIVPIITPEIAAKLPDEEYLLADEAIEMSDAPVLAARRKTRSSMMLGIHALRDGSLDALVSTGNTGALIAGSTLYLQRMDGIDRPPLLTMLPTESGGVVVVDVGGNVACRPGHLLQFARLGAAYARCMRGIERPRIGLLNVGIEPSKGTSSVREIYESLEARLSERSDLSFVGNIEGREVYQGDVDVLVTDGFTGNIFLKASEGVSSFILGYLERAFEGARTEHVDGVLAKLAGQVDYAEYPGAVVCGVEGLVIKCHGYSDQRALCSGIRGAAQLLEQRFVERMRAALD